MAKHRPKEGQSYEEWQDEFGEMVRNKPGFYDIDEADYHKSYGLNQSKLKNLLKSPAHYMEKIKNPESPTPPMVYGSAVHKLFFETDQFDQSYVDIGSIDRRSKAGKEKYAEMMDRYPNATLLKSDVMDSVRECVEALRSSELAMSLLAPIKDEVSVEQSAYGYLDSRILSRGRGDACHWKRRMLADLKTTTDVRPHAFQGHSERMGYHIQGAYYLDLWSTLTGEKWEKFVMLCIESSPPYAIQPYVLDPVAIKKGRELYRKAIDTYLHCSSTNEWPGYEPTILNLTLPRWALD